MEIRRMAFRVFRILTLLWLLTGAVSVYAQPSVSSYYRARNSYNRARFGPSMSKYRRACKVMERRRKGANGFFTRIFRRRSFGGTMITETP